MRMTYLSTLYSPASFINSPHSKQPRRSLSSSSKSRSALLTSCSYAASLQTFLRARLRSGPSKLLQVLKLQRHRLPTSLSLQPRILLQPRIPLHVARSHLSRLNPKCSRHKPCPRRHNHPRHLLILRQYQSQSPQLQSPILQQRRQSTLPGYLI